MKKCHKVLFLDVDGVLNNGSWAMEMFERGVRIFRDGLLYGPSLAQLRRIIDETGADIVVSSSWRLDPEAYDNLREWLAKYGMAIRDQTPHTGGDRGEDITAWFNQNPERYRYVILDDDGDMGRHLKHLVRTDFNIGLTEEKADECVRRLGRR